MNLCSIIYFECTCKTGCLYIYIVFIFPAPRGRCGRGRGRGRGNAQHDARSRSNRSQSSHSRSPSPTSLTWSEGVYTPQRLPFTGTPGIQVPIPSTVLGYVQLFCFTADDLNLLVQETNRYAEQFFAKTPKDTLPPHSCTRQWEPTDENEMKCFLALVVNMGLVMKHDLDEYWSTAPPIETPFFSAVMTRNRFELLLKFFHTADNTEAKARGEDGYDPLYRIRQMHDRYLSWSRSTYIPEQNLSLDEATMLWKGHVSYRVYNPNKPAKFGVKLYELCESSSAYVVDWQVYTGKTQDTQEHGHTYRVVMDLLRHDLRHKGYNVYMDRYYSGPKLYSDLVQEGIGASGTVMPNRKGMPKQILKRKLKRGEMVAVHKAPLVCAKWKDKRDIHMLSTIDSMEMNNTGKNDRRTGEPIQKPACVLQYNIQMGGVDHNDQLAKYYSFARKTMKVWKKEFFFLTNSMVLQAYIMYKKYTEDKSKLSQYAFRMRLVEELVSWSSRINFPQVHQRRLSKDAVPLCRLTARHFPAYIPRTPKKLHPPRQCVVCKAKKIRKESVYWCPDCRAALCAAPCFKIFHTLKHYGIDNDSEESD